jgi:hypothetical protein
MPKLATSARKLKITAVLDAVPFVKLGVPPGRGAAPGRGASTSTTRFAAQSLRGRSAGR